MFRITYYNKKEFNESVAFIGYIYSYLFRLNKLDFYDYVTIELNINERDEYRFFGIKTPNAFVFKKFDVMPFYDLKDDSSRKLFLLELLHSTLLQFSKVDTRITVTSLENIKNTILQSDFIFDIEHLNELNKKKPDIVGKIIIRPDLNFFNFFVTVSQSNEEKCRILLYRGKPSAYYIEDIFFKAKWKGPNEFIITGRRSEIEFHIYSERCIAELINTGENKNKAPIFNLFRADSAEEALHDYISSLNPAIASIITQSSN